MQNTVARRGTFTVLSAIDAAQRERKSILADAVDVYDVSHVCDRLPVVYKHGFIPKVNRLYLVPLFPRFSHFTFRTFVALETYRE